MENIQIELVDMINAAKIMEHAIKCNVFSVEELASVAPVVSKFIAFANNALADIEKAQQEVQKTESQDTEGDANE